MNPNVILCPIDSMSGRSALAQAVELARWYDADLHVADLRAGRARREPADTCGAEPSLDWLLEGVQTRGVRLTTAVLHGEPLAAVARHARLLGVDLVVVAPHGHRYGVPWRRGTYAADLARVLACPTLAVPEAARGPKRAFMNILCATDLSAASTAARDTALSLAQQSGGKLTLLHVSAGYQYDTAYSGVQALEVIREHRARMDKMARDMQDAVPPDAFNWCSIDTAVLTGVPHRTVLSTAADLDADLIVMGVSERHVVARAVMASTTTPVIRAAGCPVLVVGATGAEPSRVLATDLRPWTRTMAPAPRRQHQSPTLTATRRIQPPDRRTRRV